MLYSVAPPGIRDLKELNDADLIVSDEIWKDYKDKPDWQYKITENGVEHIESTDGKIEMWHDWRPWYQDITPFINSAEIINGLPFVKLEHVLEWKKKFGREKDMKDVETIKKFLRGSE